MWENENKDDGIFSPLKWKDEVAVYYDEEDYERFLGMEELWVQS